jgi:hypothetical protein
MTPTLATILTAGNTASTDIFMADNSILNVGSVTTSSDRRVKRNIVDANLALCANTIQSLPLRYFSWEETYAAKTHRTDKHVVGFIAQEVKNFFPKSVAEVKNNNIDDFNTLDLDQIYKTTVGATKYLLGVVSTQTVQIHNLQQIIELQSTTLGKLTTKRGWLQ